MTFTRSDLIIGIPAIILISMILFKMFSLTNIDLEYKIMAGLFLFIAIYTAISDIAQLPNEAKKK
jgi:hypothetical protein